MTKSQKTTQQKSSEPIKERSDNMFLKIMGGVFAVLVAICLIEGESISDIFETIHVLLIVSAIIAMVVTGGINSDPSVTSPRRDSFESSSEPYESISTSSKYHYISGNSFNHHK